MILREVETLKEVVATSATTNHDEATDQFLPFKLLKKEALGGLSPQCDDHCSTEVWKLLLLVWLLSDEQS